MEDNRLPLVFYQSFDTLQLARELLGCELVHDSPDGTTSGIIVETEAYLQDDPACHAYNRTTPRTQPMYSDPGTIYVYLIYGMYQCVNVVSNKRGIGEAVLIRALQPTAGTELMQQRRKTGKKISREDQKAIPEKELCRGPGKLVRAMGIEKSTHNQGSFLAGPLYINKPIISDFDIRVSQRIGIQVGKELPYRFSIMENPYVSR